MAPFEGIRIPAIGISTVITAAISSAVALYVFNTDRSFESWQRYAFFFVIGGFGLGGVGFFTGMSLLMLAAGLVSFASFVADLTYEIWAVRENRYASDLRNAIGIYVAVMGVLVHVLM